jgi:hypothetical protein
LLWILQVLLLLWVLRVEPPPLLLLLLLLWVLLPFGPKLMECWGRHS